jgi:hypothetical protein
MKIHIMIFRISFLSKTSQFQNINFLRKRNKFICFDKFPKW